MIGFISEKLLIPILDFFYGLVPSYGLAIVALTVVIRIALFPLSAGSIRSARRMKIAQPVMQKRQAEIKSKFSGDPKKQQEELGKKGRILLRPSGTEDLIRIMVECTDLNLLKTTTEIISQAIIKENDKK